MWKLFLTSSRPSGACLNIHYNLSVQVSHHKQNTDLLEETAFKNAVDWLLKSKHSTCKRHRNTQLTVVFPVMLRIYRHWQLDRYFSNFLHTERIEKRNIIRRGQLPCQG